MRKMFNVLGKTGKVFGCFVIGIVIYGVIAIILARFTSWGDR